MRTLRRGIAVAIIGASAVGATASAGTAAPVGTNERCAQLQLLAEDSFRALTAQPLAGGRRPETAAERLRSIAKGELIPKRLKPSLRFLARLFDRAASGASITELVPLAPRLAAALVDVQLYTSAGCPARGHEEPPPLR
jgi:hypothetical protein